MGRQQTLCRKDEYKMGADLWLLFFFTVLLPLGAIPVNLIALVQRIFGLGPYG
jgi:hypothetical protein